MGYAIAIVLALLIVAVAIDMIRKRGPKVTKPESQIIVDLDRR